MMKLLPFDFKKLSDDVYLMVNNGGRYAFLNERDWAQFSSLQPLEKEELYHELKSKNFIANEDFELAKDLTANQLRARKGQIFESSFLAMVVVTGRCNFACKYCQVSSLPVEFKDFDLKWRTAKDISEFIFSLPYKFIKIEFQGGEPLLNWEVVKDFIEYSKILNKVARKEIEFVICTNLSLMNEDMADFCAENNVCISTSIDGPRDIQNSQRIPRDKGKGYELFLEKLVLSERKFGRDKISPLLTLTHQNIFFLKEIVDHYRELGFNGIFIRDLHFYGNAITNSSTLAYSDEEFAENYFDAIEYILWLNSQGERFIEYNLFLYLKRILTPASGNFVDFQSPTGAITNSLIFDHIGNMYPSDEARMLSRMKDETFLLGNVTSKTFRDILQDDFTKELIQASILEVMPGCSDCVYKLFCAGDPIRAYLENKKLFKSQYGGDFCKKNQIIFDWIFQKLYKRDSLLENVFWSWMKG